MGRAKMIGAGHGGRSRKAEGPAAVPTSETDSFFAVVSTALEGLPDRIVSRFACEPGAALGHIIEVEVAALIRELRPRAAGGTPWHGR